MNDEKCWMTKNNLDLQKNLNNVEEFKGCVDYLHAKESVLWRQLLVSSELSIDTSKVNSYCVTMRTQYKLGVWDIESTTTHGVFKLFHDLLDKFNFPFVVKLFSLLM